MPFYNVPIFPGVPPILRPPGFVNIALALLTADASTIVQQFLRRPWGLYLGGVPAIFADSVKALDFSADQRISSYPVEPNAFSSYNKVREPYRGRLRYSTGGSEDSKRVFIESVIAAFNSLESYDLVMPEFIFPDVNVVHFDFRRQNDKGVGLLTIDVWCEQIRQTATAEFTQTQQPSGSATQSTGSVQTSEVPFFGAIT